MSQNPIFIHLIYVEPLRNEKSLKNIDFFGRVPPPGLTCPGEGL